MNETFSFWNDSSKYYQYIKDHHDSLLSNTALKQLVEATQPGDIVLDIGCGEGSKIIELETLIPDLACSGIDISEQAIRSAQEQAPHIEFRSGNIEELPYPSAQFDVVFSTFTFEHVTNPQIILDEMIRVLKPGGKVIIVCPNFGSPIYRSPITPRIPHLIRGIQRDLRAFFIAPTAIDWYPETPWLDVEWQPDYDTTILPYIYTMQVLYPNAICSSHWSGSHLPDKIYLKIPFWICKQLGLVGIYPFKWWGQYFYFEYTKPS